MCVFYISLKAVRQSQRNGGTDLQKYGAEGSRDTDIDVPSQRFCLSCAFVPMVLLLWYISTESSDSAGNEARNTEGVRSRSFH